MSKRNVWWMFRGYPTREMCRAEGYVMIRHKGCLPFIWESKKWDSIVALQEQRKNADR